MIYELRQAICDHDEISLEQMYFEQKCPHFLMVDWREDDARIVAYCAESLKLEGLTAEWRDADFFIRFKKRDFKVSLQMDEGDRHITICALNEILSPNYELRYIVVSQGSDTIGFAALSIADWHELEVLNATAVEENFIDCRKLPNVVTQLTQKHLPANARERLNRMVERDAT